MADQGSAAAASSESSPAKSLHPVYTVSNIQHKVRVLDGTKVSYPLWVKLFTLHAKGYNVLDHIDGTPPPAKDTPEFATWENIDSIVLQWIYGTLSDALVLKIIADDSTALEAWLRVKRHFNSNRGPRSQALQHELANTTLASMPTLEAYCQKIQDLTDQLKALDFPMNDQQRVLHLVKGLPKEYDTIASILNNSLPTWDDAVEQLVSETGRMKTRDAVTNPSAIAAAIPSSASTDSPHQPPAQPNTPQHLPPYTPPHNRSAHSTSHGPPNNRPNPRNSNTRSFNHNRNNRHHQPPPQNSYDRTYNTPPPHPNTRQQQPFYPPFWAPPYWTPPPCPYPTQSWSQPWYPQASSGSSNTRGNNRAAQAHLTEVDPLEPTQLADAVHALSVDSGEENDQWNFDTGFQGWHDPEPSQQYE
ncbi:hypothetical protein Hdeb2414_s0024g00645491 [Helianthus debilis subsp. tardiflorus]